VLKAGTIMKLFISMYWAAKLRMSVGLSPSKFDITRGCFFGSGTEKRVEI
jgi:hypothetical protein